METQSISSFRIKLPVSFVVLLLAILFSTCTLAQLVSSNGQETLEQLLEERQQALGDDADVSEYMELLGFRLENPLNLNQCTEDELGELLILNSFQLKAILQHRNQRQGFLSLYELQLLPGMTEEAIARLVPFVKVVANDEQQNTDLSTLKRKARYGRHESITKMATTIEKPVGFIREGDNPEKYYQGNRLKLYQKYRYRIGEQWSAGITAEKDPGEAFTWNKNIKGFDCYSLHASYSGNGLIRKIVIGDFQAGFGQGLILGGGYGGGKSSMVMNIMKAEQYIRPYSSTDENLFFRGAGITLGYGNFTLTAFGSFHSIDANTDSASQSFSSFQLSGIHGTPLSLAKKHNLTETCTGGRLTYRKGNFSLGMSGIMQHYNLPLKKDTTPITLYDFRGQELWNISTDAAYRFKALHLFSEVATGKNGGSALLAGALLQLHSRFSMSMLYRNYQPEYQVRFGSAFSEASGTRNEKGFYMGFEMIPFAHWQFSAYIDSYHFPWLRSGIPAPGSGTDFYAQLSFIPARAVNMYLRIKCEQKEEAAENLPEGSFILPLEMASKTNIRYHIEYVLSKNLRFKNRIEMALANKEEKNVEKGFLLYHDVEWKHQRLPIWLAGRISLFNTDSYNTRIYSYESDVRNSYSVPAYYDKGSNVYLVARYEPMEMMRLELKVGRTSYANRQEIGSGLNMIDNNQKTDLHFLIRIKF